MHELYMGISHILIIIGVIWLIGRFKRKSGIKTGIIEKHIGPYETPTFSKTTEMLDEEVFWRIIDESIKNTQTKSLNHQIGFISEKVKDLRLKEIVGFRMRTDKLLYDTYNSEMWCAGYIMNGGCSDDSFEYFRCWVISRGKEAYYKAKENPDSLISEVNNSIESYDLEDFWYVANWVFTERTGKNLYDYVDYENFKTHEGKYPKFEFTWEEDNPESMRKICPNLYKKFVG